MRAVKTRQPVVIHFYSFFGLSKKHCCPCSVVLHAPVQLGSLGGVTMQPQTVGRLPPVWCLIDPMIKSRFAKIF